MPVSGMGFFMTMKGFQNGVLRSCTPLDNMAI